MPATKIPLFKSKPDAKTNVKQLLLKAGVYAGKIYLYREWDDRSKDIVHKPWVWDKARQKYVMGKQYEDRLAIQLKISGEYSSDWRSGKEFKADMWHWKASRSNPLGLAHDKLTIISTNKLLRAWKIKAHDGSDVYISRPSDNGSKIYTTKRYRKYQKDIMPKYILNKSASGSIADIKANGHWFDGKWRLELARDLDTGHADDVVLPRKGGKVMGGIAIFDRSSNDDHAVSKNLLFQL